MSEKRRAKSKKKRKKKKGTTWNFVNGECVVCIHYYLQCNRCALFHSFHSIFYPSHSKHLALVISVFSTVGSPTFTIFHLLPLLRHVSLFFFRVCCSSFIKLSVHVYFSLIFLYQNTQAYFVVSCFSVPQITQGVN